MHRTPVGSAREESQGPGAAQTSFGDLRRALQEEWVAIPEERVRRLTISMRRRCMAVMAANDGHNRY